MKNTVIAIETAETTAVESAAARPSERTWRTGVPFQLLVLALVSAVLSLPMLLRGPMPASHDGTQHINFCTHFAEQFWHGDLYPRWLINMNHGLGTPSLFVYPPMPAFVYSLLLPGARLLHLNAFNLGEYLSLLVSAIAAWLWIGTMASQRVALFVAGIYVLLPYHLAVDFYRRDALAECWALAFMPLALYFTVRIVQRKRFAVSGLAVSYALLIVSHLITVLMFSALPLLLAFVLAERGRRMRALLTVAGGLGLGTALSSFYLLPALASAKYFSVTRAGYRSDWSIDTNLLAFGKGLFTGNSGKSGFVRAVSLITVNTALFIALCGGLALKYGPRTRRAQIFLWMGVCLLPLFMMSSVSMHVWQSFRSLAGAIQYPWRLDSILCIAALPLAAFLLSDIAARVQLRYKSLIIVLLFAATWTAGFVATIHRYSLPPYKGKLVDQDDGWFNAWSPEGLNEISALHASAGPHARFLSGQGEAVATRWSPRDIEVHTNCAACGPLMINQFYYPAWQATLLPENTSLPVTVEMPEGLVKVSVPAGQHDVRFTIPRAAPERLGDGIAALSCALILMLLGFEMSGYRFRRAL